MYVNLHSHSFYSVLDGYSSPDELAKRAAELGMPGLALTDHGTLSGNRDFQKACATHGIKPILGIEAYISPTDRFDRRAVTAREDNTQLYNHLVLLGKHAYGYKQLSSLSEAAWREGYYYKPRIDKELLEQHRDGLIALSGCLNGLIAKAIERGDMEAAREHTRWFKDTFDRDFYMEIQAHNPPEINAGLIDLAREFGVKPVATLDCHFTLPEERAAEELMLILATQNNEPKGVELSKAKKMDFWERMNYLYPNRQLSFEHLDLYLMGVDEINKALSDAGLDADELIDNTLEVINKIGEYERHEGVNLLPRPKSEPYATLASMCYSSLRERNLGDEYKERLKEELEVIKAKDFSSYFLIVSEIVSWAKRQGILVGPGRGSAAGSLVCYLLDITTIDPIEHGLLFGRFVNVERNDMPDIDIDFQDDRRGEVKDFIKRKFKNVATVSTFSYFKGTGTVRDVARVFRIPLDEVNAAVENVQTLDEFYTSPTTREFRKKHPEVEEYCRLLEGRIRSVGMHAAGVVVSKEPIEDYAPIEYRKDKGSKAKDMIPVVALNKNAVEELGLLKIDTLGLKALSVISTALDNIKKSKGVEIDLDKIPFDDAGVYEMLSRGETRGVFQAEAGPYTNVLKRMRVTEFNDLIISTALIRPGAMNTIGEEYINRDLNISPTVYINDVYRNFTEETLGVVVYQEQVMRCMVELAGMSWGDADRVRSIIGKKKDPHEFDAYKDKFIKGAQEHGGLTKAYASKLWHDFEAHAGYSFNKSHAVAYSVLTYQTAWLKHHYPVEFMAANLAHETSTAEISRYLLECRRLGIRVLMPHINRSDVSFSIDGDAIRFGLANVRYLAENAANTIIRARPFNSYAEFYEFAMTKGSGLSTRIVGALNRVNGAVFDDHPPVDIRDNLYEFLGIPVFDNSWMTDNTMRRLTPAAEYKEGDGALIYGMVSEINSKPGATWNRVTVIDDSGEASFFTGPDPGVEKGKMYVVLAGNKRIIDVQPIDTIRDSDKMFVRYLLAKRVTLETGQYLVLEFNKRKTKKGAWMANTICVNSDLKLESILVFPRQFGTALKHMRPGNIVEMEKGYTDDGSPIVNNVRSVYSAKDN